MTNKQINKFKSHIFSILLSINGRGGGGADIATPFSPRRPICPADLSADVKLTDAEIFGQIYRRRLTFVGILEILGQKLQLFLA